MSAEQDLFALRLATRSSAPHTLVCTCGGDVELAGEGYNGAVRCVRCGNTTSLAGLVRRGEEIRFGVPNERAVAYGTRLVDRLNAAEGKRERKRQARLARRSR
jgi:hypothetical protein